MLGTALAGRVPSSPPKSHSASLLHLCAQLNRRPSHTEKGRPLASGVLLTGSIRHTSSSDAFRGAAGTGAPNEQHFESAGAGCPHGEIRSLALIH